MKHPLIVVTLGAALLLSLPARAAGHNNAFPVFVRANNCSLMANISTTSQGHAPRSRVIFSPMPARSNK